MIRATRILGRLSRRPAVRNHELTRRLELVAALLSIDWECDAYSVVLDGFDTHDNQRYTHHLLLSQFAQSVADFFDLVAHVAPQYDVLLVANSEFGRRIAQNAGEGTDHGLAGPVFAIGSSVRGGLYGPSPRLSSSPHGDVEPQIDFRSVLMDCAAHLDLDGGRVLGRGVRPVGLLG